MASAFAHALAAVAIGSFSSRKIFTWKFILLLALCGVFPDIDVLAFKFGIPYESVWGHRGFTHSIFFAALFGLLIFFIFYKKEKFPFLINCLLVLAFFLATLSHTLLDACTTGGLGVAFFAPFHNERYFFPWQVIRVSPIGIKQFISSRGLAVLWSELKWVGIPSVFLLIVSYFFRRKN